MRPTFVLVPLLVLLVGCPGEELESPVSSTKDLASADAPCVSNPKTHVEILNACTSAQSVDKKSTPPLLRSDGSLPPLP